MEELSSQIKKLAEGQTEILNKIKQNSNILEQLSNDRKLWNGELTTLKNQNYQLRQEIHTMKLERERDKQRQRSNFIELRGIPPTKGENLSNLFVSVCQMIECDVTPELINNIYRTKSKDRIICELLRKSDKNEILRKGKQHRISCKSLGLANVPDNPIFVNDSLTTYFASIFREAKNLQKQFKIEFIWFRDIHIFLKRNENDVKQHQSSGRNPRTSAAFAGNAA